MKKLSLFFFLATAPIYALASGQNVDEKVLCRGMDDSIIVLELWRPSQFGVALHCLHASFSPEMVACAPQGGWGLGSDDDMAELIGVTNDWKTAHNHEAGKVMASVGKRGVYFNAHSGEGIGNKLNYRWKFALERSSGQATWFGNDGKKVEYICDVSG